MDQRGLILGAIALFTFSASQSVIYQQQSFQQNQIHLHESVEAIIKKDPRTEKFLQALEAAELDTVLQGPGPFTIFAPNNQAFENLGTQKFNDLLKPENKMKLRKILLYHIVPGSILSTNLETGTLPTAIGEDLHVQVNRNGIRINGAQIEGADQEGRNGVVHVINEVLLP